MVSPIASRPVSAHQVHGPRTAPAEPGAEPGKSAQSVGHQAKAAIAEATAGDLGPNIQGKIASMIAHHLDISVLLTPSEPETHTDEMPVELGAVNDPVTETDPVPQPPVAGTVEEDAAVALLAADAADVPDPQA